MEKIKCDLEKGNKCVATCWLYNDKRCCNYCGGSNSCEKVCGWLKKQRKESDNH